MMSSVELRNKINSFLNRADDRVLNIVHSVFENYYQDETVAYHPDGSPMSRKEYKLALDKAELQIEKKDFIPAEDFERE